MSKEIIPIERIEQSIRWLKTEELANLKFQFGISRWGGRRRSRPHVLTEQGIEDRPRREIGFHVREKAPRYRARKRA